jgi:hypothetical protein
VRRPWYTVWVKHENGCVTVSETPAIKESLRDRIIDFVRVPAEQLMDHAGNPRQHPSAQKNAMAGVLHEIGIADALLVYKSERNGGRLTVIDGHMRKNEFPTNWPCLITDLSDDEADLLLQAHDPVSAMAVVDAEMLVKLRERQEFQDASVRIMLDALVPEEWRVEEEEDPEAEPEKKADMPEMELQPYEHYDYVLVCCRTTFDWNFLFDKLGLVRVDGGTDRQRKQKLGLGRAVPGDRLIALIQAGEEARAKLAMLRRMGRVPEEIDKAKLSAVPEEVKKEV